MTTPSILTTKRVGEDWIPVVPECVSTPLIPPLPPVRTINPDLYVGPTEESNWVIFGRLLVGAYPSSVHDDVNSRILSSILRLGVTTFVCLQQEYQHEGVREIEWRRGLKLRPYIFDAIRLVDNLPASFFPSGVKPEGLEFVHFPIVDCAIANDSSVLKLAHDLVDRLVRGETLYVHCWGGHGRTGTIVSIMLGLLYGLRPVEAMRWVQFVHDLRIAPMGTPSPQTEPQRQQVIRVLNAIQKGADKPRTAALMSPQPAGPRAHGAVGARSPAGKATTGAAAVPNARTAVTKPVITSRVRAATSAVSAPTAEKPTITVNSGTPPRGEAMRKSPSRSGLSSQEDTVSPPSSSHGEKGVHIAVVQNPLHPPATADINKSRPSTAATPPRTAITTGQSSRPVSAMQSPHMITQSVAIGVPPSLSSSHILARARSKASELPPNQSSGPSAVEATLEDALAFDTTHVLESLPQVADTSSGSTMQATDTTVSAAAPEHGSTAPHPDESEEEPHASLHTQSYNLLQPQATASVRPTDSSLTEGAASKQMLHISPRPASMVSLTEAPRLESVLNDPMATSVAPLVSTAASVLGLTELVASKSHIQHHVAPIKSTIAPDVMQPIPEAPASASGSDAEIPTVKVALMDVGLSSTARPQPHQPTSRLQAAAPQRWPSSLTSSNAASPSQGPSSISRTVLSSGFIDVTQKVASIAARSQPSHRSGSVPTRARMQRDANVNAYAAAGSLVRPGSSSSKVTAPSTRVGRAPVMEIGSRSGSVPKAAANRPVVAHTVAPAITPQTAGANTSSPRIAAGRARIQVHNRAAPASDAEKARPNRALTGPQPPVGSPSPRQLLANGTTAHSPRAGALLTRVHPGVSSERPRSPARVARSEGVRTGTASSPKQTTPSTEASGKISSQNNGVVFTEKDIIGLVSAAVPKSVADARAGYPTAATPPSLKDLLSSLMPHDAQSTPLK